MLIRCSRDYNLCVEVIYRQEVKGVLLMCLCVIYMSVCVHVEAKGQHGVSSVAFHIVF